MLKLKHGPKRFLMTQMVQPILWARGWAVEPTPVHPHTLTIAGRAIILHTLDWSPDHQNLDHMTLCGTGSPHPIQHSRWSSRHRPILVNVKGALQSQIGQSLVAPSHPVSPAGEDTINPGTTPPPPTIRLGVMRGGSMVDSAESSNGRVVLQGNFCSAARRVP